MFVIAFLALVTLLTIASCSGSPTQPTPPTPGALGPTVQVVSESTNRPIAGATVRAEDPKMSLTTDAEGKAQFPQALTRVSRLQIEAQGYLTREAAQNSSGVYGLLGPRIDVPDEFIQAFIMGGAGGNSYKPVKNRIDIVLEDKVFQTEEIKTAFNNVCGRIRAVGYGCDVYLTTPPLNGTLVSFHYGGETAQTALKSSAHGADSFWTVGGDIRTMSSEPAIISKLIWSLGLYNHPYPDGAASTSRVTADFSAWEKQAIALYLPRSGSVCFEDRVMIEVPSHQGATCAFQAPFEK